MMLDFLTRSFILTISLLMSVESHESPHTTVSQHVTTSSINLLMFHAYFIFFATMRYEMMKMTGKDIDPNYDIPSTVHHSKSYDNQIDLGDLEDNIENRSTKSDKSLTTHY
ncbi:hypothetical protein GUITHDRAFT_113869 [Guillardia theta CCMP2712]|uniref:Uncharacterized protein n=1 Tax=Guillardia theta (strain CCMP2712) TaxID=905079 RepID=L1IV59_GUITC|nr:hypothetical protein GUITHDRAFT_113869 [Guillardia theta CCMP2712]EKX40133.1 hypothetical protein GUITHDRAFT_113869 [Guillardia theta CCMP2712]|eukprot:XP_005827113.1 hypothetical protein GUITHDRAFT_113869 [Guillardia theta CCMP2712]